ncbi:NADP-dependent oxidoreductase [Nocardia sp. NPDC050799]|uniref:NADP-dependent oxidoreductase n=1 Tax=Nocardia sp. NPDC050799 TaxID=3154842 RepID=UPI0033E7EDCC
MRAVGCRHFGGPDVLEVVELPEPEPGEGEVRIRVHTAAVNPTDLILRAGAMPLRGRTIPGPPHIPGMDAAGVIDAVGPGVGGRLSVGDRVVALVDPFSGGGGAYAESIAVPAASVALAPAGVDMPAAATLVMNALTARAGLDALALEPGAIVAVTGAPGALGGYAVQLAKADGLRVVADAGPEDHELVRSFGADVVVGRGGGFVDAVRAEVPGGVDGLIDAALLAADVVPAVADGGKIASFRGWNGPAERGIGVFPVFVGSRASDTAAIQRLSDQAAAGALTLRVADIVPAEQAAAAHARLSRGGMRGRLVLTFV